MVIDGRMKRALLLVALSTYGCAAHIAKLSDANVVVAGSKAGGIAAQPRSVEGAPLGDALVPASRCVSSADLLTQLGPICSNESENPAQAATDPVGDLDPGKPPRKREVRWYCDERMVVRVVFEPCELGGDKQGGVTPVEIAVATHAK
jgi:hypothetical protein